MNPTNVPCPIAMPLEQFRAVRDQIRDNVRELLARLCPMLANQVHGASAIPT